MIGPWLTLPDFLESAAGRRARQIVDNAAWQSFRFTTESGINVILLFRGGTLAQVQFALESNPPGSWTQLDGSEVQKKQHHDAMLLQELGAPPYSYSWGSVISILDEKTGGSLIIVRYEP